MATATEDFIKQIDEMSVLELNDLVKALEDVDPSVSFNAHRALVAITGEQLPRESAGWSKYLSKPTPK